MSRSILALSRSFRSIAVSAQASSSPSCSYSTTPPAGESSSVVQSSPTGDLPSTSSSSSSSSTEIDNPTESSHPTTKYPPYVWPTRLPHQLEDVFAPLVIPGKETRRVKDRTIPALGSFTAENAHLSSLPTALRKSIAQKLDKLPPGEHLDILPPTTLKMWWKARLSGKLPSNPLTPEAVRESQREFLRAGVAYRERIRGQTIKVDENGDKTTTVTGKRIYLPNIVYKLVRNQTAFIRGPQGHPIGMEPYNPYEATFRVPKSTTKTDIRSYLKAFYNLDTTFVRTDIRQGKLFRTVKGWSRKNSERTYKRAVVGLTKPFHYPNDLEEMEGEEKELRIKQEEFEFGIGQRRDNLQRQMLARKDEKKSVMTRNSSKRTDQILKATAARRDLREQALRDQAHFQRERRWQQDSQQQE